MKERKNRFIQEIELKDISLDNFVIIDIRSKREYKEYHLKNAIHIPAWEIKQKIRKIVPNQNQHMLICCQSGIRSAKVIPSIEEMGYTNVFNLKGGLENI